MINERSSDMLWYVRSLQVGEGFQTTFMSLVSLKSDLIWFGNKRVLKRQR